MCSWCRQIVSRDAACSQPENVLVCEILVSWVMLIPIIFYPVGLHVLGTGLVRIQHHEACPHMAIQCLSRISHTADTEPSLLQYI